MSASNRLSWGKQTFERTTSRDKLVPITDDRSNVKAPTASAVLNHLRLAQGSRLFGGYPTHAVADALLDLSRLQVTQCGAFDNRPHEVEAQLLHADYFEVLGVRPPLWFVFADLKGKLL
jgi:hypothetical protein